MIQDQFSKCFQCCPLVICNLIVTFGNTCYVGYNILDWSFIVFQYRFYLLLVRGTFLSSKKDYNYTSNIINELSRKFPDDLRLRVI